MQLEMDLLERLALDDMTETVVWTSRRRAGAGGDQVDSIHAVRRHQVSIKESAQSGGAYAAGDVVFRAHRANLPKSFDETPKMGDWLADDKGVRYTIIAVDRRRRDATDYQSYRIQARDLRIHFDLQDTITIETPVMALTKTGAGEVTNWETKYRDLAARVQKLTEATAEERAILGTKGSYAVTLEREVIVTMRDRINVGGPVDHKRPAFEGGEALRTPARYLQIVGYRAAESITELPVIEAEEQP
jgi:hypothetical protein